MSIREPGSRKRKERCDIYVSKVKLAVGKLIAAVPKRMWRENLTSFAVIKLCSTIRHRWNILAAIMVEPLPNGNEKCQCKNVVALWNVS